MKVKLKEAAEILGVSPDTVRRRLKSGDLDGEKVFDGGVEIWLVELPDHHEPQSRQLGFDPVVPLLLDQIEELKRDRDRWHAMAARLSTRREIDSPIALGSGQVVDSEPDKRSWWERLLRRG